MNEADKDNLKEIVGIANTAKAIAKSPGTTAKAIIEKAYDFYSCMDVLADLDPGNQTELSREIHTLNRERMQPHLLKEIKKKRTTLADAMALYEESLRKEAPWNFEQYMIYMEFGRPAEEKFYIPRRKVLKPFVDALQALEDGELDELFLSQPPRTGKTALSDFFMSWEAGKHPLNSCLYSSCSDTVTKSFYNGLAEIMKDNVTYRWNLVFPDEPIKKWNAEYQTCNVLKNNRYPTITCRSIDGTLNGACDCDNILMGDDLCKGIEQAMNKDVMGRLWQKVSNDFLTRAKQGAKKVWIGTRWSLIDPIGIRIEMLENDPAFKDYRFKVINIPALNDLGESNFNYKHGVGFTTEYYVQTRAGFERNDDMASWNAQYMGQPIEREGSLFSPGEMRFYSGVLPEGEPDRLFMAVDPAWGGSDFCAAPVCMQYGQEIYVPEVVFTNEDKRTSLPELCRTIQKYGVRTVQIEANKMTEGFADELREMLNKKNIRCTITTKAAPTNKSKEDRIRDRAPDIRENFLFLEAGLRAKHYQAFLDNVFSFTIIGKNKHDDAPDSLAMASDMVFKRSSAYAHTFKRFF